MSGLFVGPIADVGHQCGSLELAANPRINTLGPSPVCLRNKQHHHPGWNSNWMLQQQHTKFKKDKCWYHPKPKSIKNSLQAYWGEETKRKKKRGGGAGGSGRQTNLNTDFAVMLHALELLDPLLNDIALDQRRDHCCYHLKCRWSCRSLAPACALSLSPTLSLRKPHNAKLRLRVSLQTLRGPPNPNCGIRVFFSIWIKSAFILFHPRFWTLHHTCVTCSPGPGPLDTPTE